jgi:cysteine-rich repeat protein
MDAPDCDGSTHTCPALVPKTAGTACGTGNNCVQGSCIKPVCGDGIVAQGIETCDDGNIVNGDGCNNDCTPSCSDATAATDCAGKVAPCATAMCTNSVCASTADTASTASCTFGSGSTATCSNGMCGTCGNGTTDPGEQCDDGNLIADDGCKPDCTYTCTTNADCDDGDPCNGTETCDATTHKCKAGNVKIDGFSCGSGKICIDHGCRPSFCGDGYTNAATGEKCDPPNTTGCDSACKALVTCSLNGDWAVKITEQVSWGGDALGLLEYGQGQILQWAKMTIKQTGRTFTSSVSVCGLTIPDFKTTSQLGAEWYGITFANSMFDSPSMGTFAIQGTLSNLAPNAKVDTSEVATLLGVTVTTPPGPFASWPDDPTAMFKAPWTIVDQDNDKNPGITAVAKTGTVPPGSNGAGSPYKDPIVDVSHGTDNPLRASSLYLVIRQTATLVGTLNTCTTMSGDATPPPVIDNHIIGCQQDSGAPCDSGMASTADSVRPAYAVVTGANSPGATFKAVKITDGGGCAAVRTALP